MNTEENNEQNEKILTQKVENDRDDTKLQLHTSDEKNIQRQDSQPKSQQKKQQIEDHNTQKKMKIKILSLK